MRKAVTMLVALCAFSMMGCSKAAGSSVAAKTTVNIQFVPSIDAGRLATLTQNLAPILEKYEPEYKFNLTAGDSYAAVTEALLSDQMDIGFLTASGYAEATLKHPGKVSVLLTSVRQGYKVQTDDFPGTGTAIRDTQRKAMNGEITAKGVPVTDANKADAYKYLGEQSTTTVNWYSSQLTVLNKYYVDANHDGVIDIKDMAGLKIARQGTTSGAGYLRPLKYLNDNGMKMVDTLDTDSSKEIQGMYIKGYDQAFAAMEQDEVAGFWGYTDVRYAVAYSKQDSEFYQKEKAFTDSKVVAITDGIYNDTISCRANLPANTQRAVMNAFELAAHDGSITTEGTGSYYLYNIYSHTGYTEAKDSDFDGERDFYTYCVDNNLI
jgi:phosphonate transport system substrate-binding protein